MNIGFALCGSFCTFEKVFPVMDALAKQHNVFPIFSTNACSTDSRFGRGTDFVHRAEEICEKEAITTLSQAEPIGPKKMLDILLIAPCTGNTLAKLAHSIADTPVTMAAKSHLRNARPVLLAVSTNDGLAGAAENIGRLLNRKHCFFVPLGQDDSAEKPTSLIADFSQIPAAIDAATAQIQLQPVLIAAAR